ncbi:MAG: aminotransferase class I/II-fold pyridoxal phosphate-dependent enzyme, partial [Gemmatimonadaceae bacterium]
MPNHAFTADLQSRLDQLKADKVYKRLNYLETPQSAWVEMEGRGRILILSSNNYLGLCDEPSVVAAGIAGLEKFGAGTGSVRFICGTFTIHRELEQALAKFVGTEASMSFVSAWNANEGLTATVVEEGDLVLSDELNHASIIDSMRLAKSITKCTTAVYKHSNLDDLVAKLEANKGAKRRLIWTDGVFSMEGSIAKLPEILQIARDHEAIVIMDDSHSTGVLGKNGRGTAEHHGVLGEVDVITSTLGKAVGGASGGFVAGSAALCDMLTQRSRPQLFSNALPPTVAASALQAVRVMEAQPER